MPNIAKIKYTSCTQCTKCFCKIDNNSYDYRCVANGCYWPEQKQIGLYDGPMYAIDVPDWCPHTAKEDKNDN